MRKPRLFQKLLFVTALLISTMQLSAQQTFPENGVADPRHGHCRVNHVAQGQRQTGDHETSFRVLTHPDIVRIRAANS